MVKFGETTAFSAATRTKTSKQKHMRPRQQNKTLLLGRGHLPPPLTTTA
jgi:hypothetical protein